MTWRQHFFYRTEVVRTTWKLRLAIVIVIVTLAVVTRPLWTVWIARSLMCAGGVSRADVLLIENFDPHYVVFERAAELQRSGLAPRALVPIEMSGEHGDPNAVSQGIAEIMARQARLAAWESLPIRHVEPISLNAAIRVRDRLGREHLRSIIVVAPAFRSRRTALIYRTVLDGGASRVSCVPVSDARKPEQWLETWHGVQSVAEEFLKLQYYRFYVLPFLYRPS